MIENDLLREAMYIKEVEAKLEDIQMNKAAIEKMKHHGNQSYSPSPPSPPRDPIKALDYYERNNQEDDEHANQDGYEEGQHVHAIVQPPPSSLPRSINGPGRPSPAPCKPQQQQQPALHLFDRKPTQKSSIEEKKEEEDGGQQEQRHAGIPLKMLTVQEVGCMLRSNNLGLYEEAFRKNCVDGQTLMVSQQEDTHCSFFEILQIYL